MNSRCLYCYNPLEKGGTDFHEKCCEKFFGTRVPPEINLDEEGLEKMANEIVIRSIAITGVQPKLSLTIEKIPGNNKNSRLTIVGVNGNFILKPQSSDHPLLPENEDATMHLAELLGIKVAEHSLVRLKSGYLAYITKRFDRNKGVKFHCEDLCQLSEELTEKKYSGSMEKVGKVIKKYSTFPLLEALRFFEISLFSFITGNADMHMKNFSLLKDENNNYRLAPGYDLLSIALAVPEDNEEMALTINGKKNRIELKDFNALGANLGLSEKQVSTIYNKFRETRTLTDFLQTSFLPKNLQEDYCKLIIERTKALQFL